MVFIQTDQYSSQYEHITDILYQCICCLIWKTNCSIQCQNNPVPVVVTSDRFISKMPMLHVHVVMWILANILAYIYNILDVQLSRIRLFVSVVYEQWYAHCWTYTTLYLPTMTVWINFHWTDLLAFMFLSMQSNCGWTELLDQSSGPKENHQCGQL